MNQQQKQQLLKTVQKELNKVITEIAKIKETTQPISPSNAIGRISRMDAIGNKALNKQVLKTIQTRKEKLETILARSNQPDFGCCMICMNPIATKRIIAIPEATLCMRCASR